MKRNENTNKQKNLVPSMTGYKATDQDGKCRGYQFSLPTKQEDGSWTPGDWHEHDGDIELCKAGFHFCSFPSGPWAYYQYAGTRIFQVEAELVQQENGAGADIKHACKRIRLVSEVSFDGHWNTGHSNTGDRNTGDSNTGNWNTGHSNTGHSNTGDRNTGHRNTGDRNTGHRNTGDSNTGNSNTGHSNTGHSNTGDSNTGYGNGADRATGFFCQEPQTVKCFDVETNLSYEDFTTLYPYYSLLGEALLSDAPINPDLYSALPGFTPEKLQSLHAKFIAGRKK